MGVRGRCFFETGGVNGGEKGVALEVALNLRDQEFVTGRVLERLFENLGAADHKNFLGTLGFGLLKGTVEGGGD